MHLRHITTEAYRVVRLPLHSLRARLFSFILLLLIPALALVLFATTARRAHDSQRSQDDALRYARLVASTQSQQIEGARQLLTTLAQLPYVRAAQADECSAQFADLLATFPNYTNFSLLSLDGDVLCSALTPPPGLTSTSSELYDRVQQTRDFVVGNYRVGRITGQAVLVLAYPVYDAAGDMNGVVVAGLSLEWLGSWLGQVELPPGSMLEVIDSEGTVLARYPTVEGRVGQPMPESEVYSRVRDNFEGTLDAVDFDGERRLYGFTHISGIDVVVGMARDVALAEANRFQTLFLLGVVATATLLLIAGWWGADLLIARPVDNLVTVTERLVTGDWTARTHLPDSTAELDRLAFTINQLAWSLERREADVARFTAELTGEIEARRLTEVRLHNIIGLLTMEVDARRKAQQSDARKMRFLAMVSHELRTPLTAIKGFATTLLAEDVGWDADSQNDFIHIIDEEADTLLDMVEDLLDLAQLESGTFSVNLAAANIHELIAAVLPQLNGLAARHQLTLDLPDQPLTAQVDSQRIKQVLINLVSNAAKYSPEGTTIRLTVVSEADRLRVSVSDQGKGIKPEDWLTVFKPFNQLNTRLSQVKSIGLGLAICKGIVEAHAGRIWIESTSPQGTTFAFELPLSAANAAPLPEGQPASRAS